MTEAFLDRNQRHLAAHLAHIAALLERHAGKAGAAEAAPVEAPEPDAGSMLDRLTATFHLSPFERDLLLLCAGVVLDARVARLSATIDGERGRRAATFGLALAALPDAHWSAIAPTGPLRRWRLVEPAREEAIAEAALAIDERILHYLTGISYLDERLDGLLDTLPATGPLTASQEAVAQRMIVLWTGRDGESWPVIELCGNDGEGKARVAASACQSLGLALMRLRAEDIPATPRERVMLARLAEREMALTGGALMLIEPDEREAKSDRLLAGFAEEINGPLILASREPLAQRHRPRLRLDLSRPGPAEQRVLWEQTLGPLAAGLDGQLEQLVNRFRLDGAGIAAACATARTADADALGDALWTACRVQARRWLDDLAQRIEALARWDDLVLPPAQLGLLQQVAMHVRNAAIVYESWGFARKASRGLGISALFTGSSGTGKTMAAEVLANDLSLDLYRIDLSQVVSKYIGETEKNLRRIFDAAEESGAILLFDEADALFGKRSEVKDSHDRYANIEVSYLLQRMEAYHGLAILTTNLKSAIDQAFMRRIRFVIQFPFPDNIQRCEIWRRIFPAETPTRDLDPMRLAQLNIAGGHIRNVAIGAAFLAADRREPVTMAHIHRAALAEYAKLEKPVTSTELGGWP
jgi:hypothetical protein